MLKKVFKTCAPLPLLERMINRTQRVYALGPPKSGTTSIAKMFSDFCRADHEPHRPATVRSMHDHFVGGISDEQLRQSYRTRDKQMLLDVESNCFLAYRPDLLCSTFPDAKFVVLIREPMVWLESILDNNLNFPRTKTPTMAKWHEVLFHSGKTPVSSSDELLVEMGLYPVGSYLEYWTRTYDRCLRSLGDANCLLVGTNQITARAEEIGQFVGLDASGVSRKHTHGNRTAEKHQVLQRLNRAHVEESLNKICQPLISEFNLAPLLAR